MYKYILSIQVEMDEDFKSCKITSGTNVKDEDKLAAMIAAGSVAIIQNEVPEEKVNSLATATGVAIITFADKPMRDTKFINMKDLH